MSKKWMVAMLMLCMVWMAIMPAVAEGLRLLLQAEARDEIVANAEEDASPILPWGRFKRFEMDDYGEETLLELPDGYEWADEFELPDGFEWADEFGLPDDGQPLPEIPEDEMAYRITPFIPWGASYTAQRLPLPTEFAMHPLEPKVQ